MSPGGFIAVAAWVTFAGLVAYGLWRDPIKPWLKSAIDELFWQRFQRRSVRTIDRDRSEIQRRLSAFELAVDEFNETFAMCFPSLVERDPLEDLYSLPCAPDPRQRA